MSLVTLKQAADHLRLDIELEGSPQDPQYDDLVLKVSQAEGIIADYLEVDIQGSPTLWDEETCPPEVSASVLIILTALWDSRNGGDVSAYLGENGAVTNLLRRRRPMAIG